MADLLDLVATLVDIPSVSFNESALADYVEGRLRALPGLQVDRVGDNVVARTGGTGALRRRVIVAGHLDTVPPNGNERARVEGDTLWGLGATDMKGGLAVMLEIAARAHEARDDLSLIFYVAEEVARVHSGLLQLRRERPDLVEADVALICEPTSGAVEAGCQGVIKAEVALRGARAHVSRPWKGRNALHRLAPLLAAVAHWNGRTVGLDGCHYVEALQAVTVSGGVASNVVPDEARLEINHRFAPDRSTEQAWEWLEGFVAPFLEPGDTLTLRDSAPSAPPGLEDPLLASLVKRSGAPVVAKLGWTDVAFFAEQGIPAANFGPGNPELSHTAGEMVTRQSLEDCLGIIWSVLS